MSERTLVRLDNPDIRIVGTAERMCVCYPIAPVREGKSWGWAYTGGTPEDYDETAEQQTDDDGSPLFQDECGEDVPAWNVAVRHANGRLTPLAQKPEAREALAAVVRPHLELSDQDRNTILAALRFYQESGQGEPCNRSDEIHEIATNCGNQISMDAEGIDALCERINCARAREA